MPIYKTNISTESIKNRGKCVLMLHGVGSNEEDLYSLRDSFSSHSLISLRGPFTLGLGRYAWYPVDFSTGKPIYQIQDVERGYREIIDCIDEITLKYGIRSDDIYLMGFSQGAILSYYTLWKSPEKIGGAIGLSGRLLHEISAEGLEIQKYKGKNVFIGHGTQDIVIPASSVEGITGFIEAIGLTSTVKSYNSPHTIIREELEDIQNWLNNFDK